MTGWFLLAAALGAYLALVEYGTRFLLKGGSRRPLTVRPERFGLAHEPFRVRTSDGLTLSGWLVAAKTPTPRTIVLCHGWGTNKGEILPATAFLAGRFNLVYFDFRVCGESEGEHCTLGFLETRDFDAVVDFLKAQRPAWAERLGAYGLSMGSTVAFMGAARRPEVKAVAVENTFTSFAVTMANYTRHKWGVPRYPLMASIAWRAQRMLGADLEEWTTLAHADRMDKPVLFIHADDDPIMEVQESRTLFDRVKGPKELWIVPNARHEDIHEVAKDEYQKRLGAFFERHL